MAKNPHSIAIIRFSSIGDIVLTTPVVRALRKKFPSAKLYFVTKNKYAQLLQNNPYLEEIITFEDSLKDLVNKLRAKDIDLVVDLHKNLRSKWIKMSLKVPHISYDKLNREKWLMVTFKWNLLPYKHLVDRYFDALKSLGVENDHLGLDFHFEKTDIKIPEIDEFDMQKPFLVYAIGGTYATKRAPLHVIEKIINKQPFPVVLIGDKNDAVIANNVNTLLQKSINFCGKLTIQQSAYLMKISKGVIAHDTGMMHIAAALKKNLVSLWGNTIPEFGMYPYFPSHSSEQISTILEVDNLDCRPCSKLGYDSCPKGHFHCMNLLDWPEDLKPFE